MWVRKNGKLTLVRDAEAKASAPQVEKPKTEKPKK